MATWLVLTRPTEKVLVQLQRRWAGPCVPALQCFPAVLMTFLCAPNRPVAFLASVGTPPLHSRGRLWVESRRVPGAAAPLVRRPPAFRDSRAPGSEWVHYSCPAGRWQSFRLAGLGAVRLPNPVV